MDKGTWRHIAGFLLLIPGTLTIFILPEIGAPLVLMGTRLLGERFKWARAVNHRVDRTWAKVKSWLNKMKRKRRTNDR